MPATATVAAGQAVTWINEDAAPHAVAVKDGKASSQFAPGERASLGFDKAGSYDYSCSVHPYMTGKVIVR